MTAYVSGASYTDGSALIIYIILACVLAGILWPALTAFVQHIRRNRNAK